MRHTIELSETGEASLRRMGLDAGRGEETVLQARAEFALAKGESEEEDAAHDLVLIFGERKIYIDFKDDLHAIRSTENVMGGDACIRNTRIPVWMLVGYKRAGYTEERILFNFPSLNAADLTAAWDFYATNAERIDGERRRHEEADGSRGSTPTRTWLSTS